MTDYQKLLGESFGKLFEKRLANDQDLIVLVDDEHNRRGTGKTTLSVALASILDQTSEGLTKDKVALTAEELTNSYLQEEKGSSLILDEAEQAASKYRASSHTNLAIRKLASMGREPLQKFVVINLPNSMELDRDLKALCTVWIMVTRKGHGVVHFLGMNKYRNQVITPKKHEIKWTAISNPDLKEIMDYLAERKRDILSGETEGYIDPEEIDQLEQKAKTQTRNDLIESVYSKTDLTQQELADSINLSRSRIADILS